MMADTLPVKPSGRQQVEDLVGRSQFSEHWEDPIEATSMGIGVQICHSINGDGDIVAMFECLTRRRFDSHAGGDAR